MNKEIIQEIIHIQKIIMSGEETEFIKGMNAAFEMMKGIINKNETDFSITDE